MVGERTLRGVEKRRPVSRFSPIESKPCQIMEEGFHVLVGVLVALGRRKERDKDPYGNYVVDDDLNF